MNDRQLQLIGGAGAIGLLTVGAEFAGAPEAVLAVLGVLLVLLLPGYVTICALLPGRELSWGERLLASLAASLAISTGIGVLLAATPVGLSKDSVVVSLGFGVAVVSLCAWARTSRRLAEGGRPRPGETPDRAGRSQETRVDQPRL
jgi:uncharacterized membrane protein